MKTVIKES